MLRIRQNLIKKICGLFVLFPMIAYGETWVDSPYVAINKIYPTDAGLAFHPDYKDTTVSSCDSGSRFIISLTAVNYNVKASVLLAAFMAGKKVLLRYDADQVKACSAVVSRFIVNK